MQHICINFLGHFLKLHITVTFTSIKKGLLSAVLFLRKSRGDGWDLFSNQQMGHEVQKNFGLHMLSEVEGLVNDVFVKRPIRKKPLFDTFLQF